MKTIDVPSWDRERESRLWARIDNERRAKKRRTRALSIASIVAIPFALLLLRTRQQDSRLLTYKDGQVLEIAASVRIPVAAMSESSEVVSAAGTTLLVLENSEAQFGTELVRGDASFHVIPGGSRKWTVDAGLMTVEVVGTRFEMQRDEHTARVVVTEGKVLVKSRFLKEGHRYLTESQELTFDDRVPQTSISPIASGSAEGPEKSAHAIEDDEGRSSKDVGIATSDGGSVVSGRNSVPRPAPSATPSQNPSFAQPESSSSEVKTISDHEASAIGTTSNVTAPLAHARELAASGQIEAAHEAVVAAGGVEKLSGRANVDDLFALADIAKKAGHPEDAVIPMQRILKEFSGDQRTSLAAFSLGRICESLGRLPCAIDAFAQAVMLKAPGGLFEDALARLVELNRRAGNRTAAETAAETYLRTYPSGRHTEAIQRWLSQ